MGAKHYTIGALARLSGQSVRRIRFYADRGLLPPRMRSGSNYRVFTDTDLAKLDLICALSAAGVGLATIGKLLRRDLPLEAVLRARLDVLDAEIATKRRIAAVLRATLRIPNPTDTDLRRIWTMTHLSGRQMKALFEAFVDDLAEGTTLAGTHRQQLLELSTPVLPDDPTAEQIAAWDELSAMLADPSFLREQKDWAKTFWTDALTPDAYRAAATQAYEAARKSVAEKLLPQSPEARTIACAWLEDSAQAMGRTPDGALVAWHVDLYDRHSGRVGRYREHLAVLRGEPLPPSDREVWTWLNEAIKALPPRP